MVHVVIDILVVTVKTLKEYFIPGINMLDVIFFEILFIYFIDL